MGGIGQNILREAKEEGDKKSKLPSIKKLLKQIKRKMKKRK